MPWKYKGTGGKNPNYLASLFLSSGFVSLPPVTAELLKDIVDEGVILCLPAYYFLNAALCIFPPPCHLAWRGTNYSATRRYNGLLLPAAQHIRARACAYNY